MLQVSSNDSVPNGTGMSSVVDSQPDATGVPTSRRLAALLSLGSWQGRLFWLFVLIGPIWLLDEPLAAARLHDRKILLLGDIRDVTRQFGEPMGIAWITLVLWFLDRSRRRPLIVVIVATMIASGLASGAKVLVGRERPKVSGGTTILHGPHRPGSMTPDASFPSGHTAVAFAYAFGLSRLFPQHRKLWLFLAAGCGLSRAVGEAHFLTDVLVGAWLGWETARIFWESSVGGWLMARMDYRIPDTASFPRSNLGTPCDLPSGARAIAQGGA